MSIMPNARFLVLLITAATLLASQEIEKLDPATPRDVQIRLAAEAAPADVTDHATIMVLGKGGYTVAIPGNNGFTCLVVRERVDTVEPQCLDATGSRTLLKAHLYREQQRSKDVAEDAIKADVESGFKSGRFHAPDRPGLIYMLSPHTIVYDEDSKKLIKASGHLMFYAPYATAKTVGTGKGAPFLANPGTPFAYMIVVPH